MYFSISIACTDVSQSLRLNVQLKYEVIVIKRINLCAMSVTQKNKQAGPCILCKNHWFLLKTEIGSAAGFRFTGDLRYTRKSCTAGFSSFHG